MNKIYTIEGKEYLVWHDALKKVMYATPKNGDADIRIIRKGKSSNDLTIRKALAKVYGHKSHNTL